MSNLTYCKGLPTPIEELSPIGYSQMELFLTACGEVLHRASVETVNHLLALPIKFNKSAWNSHLQQVYQINKRHANGVIALAQGKVESAKECRRNHLKQLASRLKSAQEWLRKAEKKIKLARKFYQQQNWSASKQGCNFPLASYLDSHRTNWQATRFAIHQKKRYIYTLQTRISYLKSAPLKVTVPKGEILIVGSKDETGGNQVCQWDGQILKFRVPNCLESQFGKYVISNIGNFDRTINRLPLAGAKTWHFYRKEQRWVVAVQFTPASLPRISRHSAYGCIGIDINPHSIGWAYVDAQGNLQAHGVLPLQPELPTGQQNAQIVDACLQLATLADTFACPVVCESLDFSLKKAGLRERGKRYARMLSSWAYHRLLTVLESILANRGLVLLKCNPAYTSLIGLVKYARMYGLSSDVAAALVIARRGMRLSERLPRSVTAYLGVKPRKHVWSAWSELNRVLNQCAIVNCRHDYYSVSNWESLVTEHVEPVASNSRSRTSSKRKR